MDSIEEAKIKSKLFKKRILKSIRLLLVVVVSFAMGNFAMQKGFVIGTNSNKYKEFMKAADEYPEYNKLFEVRRQIGNLYAGDFSEEDLVNGATKGMTAALDDPYTVYMTTDEYEKYMGDNSGEFIGIGVYVTIKDGQVVVSGLINGGNAEGAGIKSGDIITKVDGEAVNGDIDKAVSLITGKEIKTLDINIVRNGEEINVFVDRGKIVTVAAEGEMLSNGIGYIILKNFDMKSSEQFIDCVEQLKNQGMKGLIIDLRENGGGYLTQAINIGSMFIPKGETITYTLDKNNKKEVYESTGKNSIDIPLVVLIDGYSASASEVLTGALRDYDIAETVGTTSYGKGVVQSIFKLENGIGGLKITTSKYYTPNGENIHKTGIKPDYEVELPKEIRNEEYSKDKDIQLQKAIEVIGDKVK